MAFVQVILSEARGQAVHVAEETTQLVLRNMIGSGKQSEREAALVAASREALLCLLAECRTDKGDPPLNIAASLKRALDKYKEAP